MSGFSSPLFIPRSYLAGLTLSTAGASATFSVAAGMAADSTSAAIMSLTAAISKTTSAWAVGTAAGGLDTGAVAISTWYHAHLIKRIDTGVVDVLFSLSVSAPTMPTNYTLFRRIGSVKTNASSQWVLFSQLGDEFLWSVPIQDIAATTLGTTATLFILSVPTGIQVQARLRGYANVSSIADVLVNSPDEATAVANVPTGNFTVIAPVISQSYSTGEMLVRTNTSAQIRAVASAGSDTFNAATFGWIDTRGKLA